MIFGVLFILFVYGSVNYYIAGRLYRWLCLLFPSVNKTLYMGVYALIAMTLVISFMPLDFVGKHLINWIGAYWMGIFIYLFIFLILTDLLLFIGSGVKIIPNPIPVRVRFYTGLAVVLLTTAFVGYGIFHAHQLKHVSYEVQLKEDTLSKDVKVVLISDLHLGAVNSEKYLEDIVKSINDLKPDIVTMAGDIFNDNFNEIKDPEKAMDMLKQISTTYGVYASLGNHDAGKTFNEMVRFLGKSNIKLLKDEYVVIDEQLILIGRVDPSPIGGFDGLERKEIKDILSTIDDKNMPIVVMDHTPSNLEQYDEHIDLVLSGHTHKGQIFPGNLITNLLFEVDYGHDQKNADRPQIIVTSGVGTWGMPMRVGSDREIVSITLR